MSDLFPAPFENHQAGPAGPQSQAAPQDLHLVGAPQDKWNSFVTDPAEGEPRHTPDTANLLSAAPRELVVANSGSMIVHTEVGPNPAIKQ